MGFMGGIFRALGFESETKTKVANKTTKANFKLKKNKNVRVDEIDGVPVYYPENYTQTKEFIEFVKNSKPIIISTEAFDKEMKEKILYFLQGFVIGIKGKFIVVEDDKLYLILPEGMEIEEE